ncbi:DUF1153 domain-containing protein [Paracoccus sp. p4-l81]|uniref:CtrA inhibitor SciP n=1 Tax=unclassified Paracoccus (in: a-proteobacteria) TaxID=2688777 RepID=UPI0035BA0CD7
MYLKKSAGPRAVTLPDGTVFTLADLPEADTRRWVASRKARVVTGVTHGLISRDEAIRRYDLSEEEFDGWVLAVHRHGPAALRATQLRKYMHL